MTRRARQLSGEEAALWARVAATVAPMKGRRHPPEDRMEVAPAAATPKPRAPRGRVPEPMPPRPVPSAPPQALDRNGLDATWDRKLAKGAIAPDFTLDLHGHSLDAAWSRLEHGLTLAQAQGARVVLVVTGRPRPVERAAGHSQRGVIRAKLLDWLAAGSHASKIAAVRGAHPRHGGAGAVYVVLRRRV